MKMIKGIGLVALGGLLSISVWLFVSGGKNVEPEIPGDDALKAAREAAVKAKAVALERADGLKTSFKKDDATPKPDVKPAAAPPKRPAVKKPASKKPAAKKPTATSTAAKKPAAKKATVRKPAVKKPAPKKPTPKTPSGKIQRFKLRAQATEQARNDK